MTHEDRQEIIDTIKTVVNGKIDRLTVSVDAIHHRLDEQDIKMAPAIETIHTLQSGRKFILWACAPVAAIGGAMAAVAAITKL